MRLYLDTREDDYHGRNEEQRLYGLTAEAHRALSALKGAGFDVRLVTAGTDFPTPHYRITTPDREENR